MAQAPLPASPCLVYRTAAPEGRADNLGDSIGFPFDLPFGESDDVEAPASQPQIPSSIILKGLPASVVEVGIGLHREPLSPPEEVDEVGADANVDLRRRQAMAPAEPEKCVLEVAASAVPGIFFADRQSEDVRLANRPAQLACGYRARIAGASGASEVGNRSGRRRDRHPGAESDLCRIEIARAVNADARTSRPARAPQDDHVACPGLQRQQPPKRCCTAVAHRRPPARQDAAAVAMRSATDSQDRREAASLGRQVRMTDCVDPPVNPMEPSRRNASADRLVGETEATQLNKGDRPVLPRRDLANAHIGVGDFPALHG